MQPPMTTKREPAIEIVSFPVEGMTCASCVNRITRFAGPAVTTARAADPRPA